MEKKFLHLKILQTQAYKLLKQQSEMPECRIEHFIKKDFADSIFNFKGHSKLETERIFISWLMIFIFRCSF